MFVFGFALSPPQGYRASSVSSVAFPLLAPNGTAAAPSYAGSSATGTGLSFSSANLIFSKAGVAYLGLFADQFQLKSTTQLEFASGVVGTSSDVILVRDAAATLAQRNGTNAQAFNVYNTWTSASNYENFQIVWASNAVRLQTNNATGTRRGLTLDASTLTFAVGSAASGTNIVAINANGLMSLTGAALAAGGTLLTVTGAAHTAMTASTESTDVLYDLSATKTFATGAVALNRDFRLSARTLAFAGASTVTDAVTLAVSGPPIAGANATITRSWIATFGALEATGTAVGTAGAVGIFGAGQSYLIVRDTTNNHEVHISAGTDRVRIGSGTSSSVDFIISGTTGFQLSSGLITITDAYNFAFSGTTGTKFGTATTQKQAWWNATPVVQGAAVADASGGATIDAEARTAINTLLARMRTYGLIAT